VNKVCIRSGRIATVVFVAQAACSRADLLRCSAQHGIDRTPPRHASPLPDAGGAALGAAIINNDARSR